MAMSTWCKADNTCNCTEETQVLLYKIRAEPHYHALVAEWKDFSEQKSIVAMVVPSTYIFIYIYLFYSLIIHSPAQRLSPFISVPVRIEAHNQHPNYPINSF